ncbi:MAG: hypothetical protein HY763_08860, partial [Planctomycetes bacterium]|nr:hypothetical protein [Planctomycetota bacterium]
MTAALLVLALIAQTPPAAPPTGDPPAAPSAPAAEKPPALLKIAGVSRLQRSFNPTAGQTATLQFTLSRAAQVAITVYGPNRETVARLLEGKECAAGLNTVVWDGRDLDGAIVPDEAYTFDVRAVAGEDSDLWDPLLNSGGESVRVAELQTLDAERLSYHLPVASRVLVRAAVVNGPLLRTIVNWEPRTAGLCVEQWDGKDADGLRRIADVENTRTAVAAMALPDETIISTGNPAIDYAYYYLTRGASRPHQPPPVRVKKAGEVLSPHWTLPVHVNRDP